MSKSESKVVSHNTVANRLRRITKHLKKHPNDEQAELSLTNSGQPRKSSIEKLGFLKSFKPSSLGLYPQVTKDVAHKLCRFDKLIRNAPFQTTPVLKTRFDEKLNCEVTEFVQVHKSKLSNFKGSATTVTSNVK